jgi:hypothetical protein
MAIPPNIFDAFMGGYDPRTDMTNSQKMAEYMRQASASQNFNQGLSNQMRQALSPINSTKPVNPEPNPVLLLLE